MARALVKNATVYIMDEPFVGVDAVTEKAIITLLKDLRQQQKTIIVVHHDYKQLKIILIGYAYLMYGKLHTEKLAILLLKKTYD